MQPKRGRPSTADARAIARVALRLFQKRGYERVTMDQVAKAAKVSRRTLFRLFPSKSDLVWDGLDTAFAQTRALALPDKRVPLRALIDLLLLPPLRLLADPLARARLKLIAASPELLHNATLRKMEHLLARVIADHSTVTAPPELVARTLVAVSFAALLWWATQHALSPEQALLTALDLAAVPS